MPTYVCRQTCQVRMPAGHIGFFESGVTQEFPDDFEVPAHFESLEEATSGLDFCTASEDELKAVKWKWSDANAAMVTAYGKGLDPSNKAKAGVIAQILDIRFRNTAKSGV